MYFATWQVWFAGAVFLVLLWTVFSLAKQVRCLRYCYLDACDWAARRLEDSREFAVDRLTEERVCDDLRFWERDWLTQLRYHREVMRRAGIARLTTQEYRYALEDR